jgi:hypothetical protein
MKWNRFVLAISAPIILLVAFGSSAIAQTTVRLVGGKKIPPDLPYRK